MPNPDIELAKTFADIARSLHAEPDLDRTLHKIVAAAVTVIDRCEHACVQIVERGTVTPAAASDDVAAHICALETELGEGPCLSTIWEHETFYSPDLAGEPRWPRYAVHVHGETGVRSVMGFRLYADESTLGALDVCSPVPEAFDETARAVGSVLAAHAAVALAAARERDTLQEALESRDVIGQAKGILMARHHINGDEAFGILRDASQVLNRKLRDVAEEVIFTGETPDRPPA